MKELISSLQIDWPEADNILFEASQKLTLYDFNKNAILCTEEKPLEKKFQIQVVNLAFMKIG